MQLQKTALQQKKRVSDHMFLLGCVSGILLSSQHVVQLVLAGDPGSSSIPISSTANDPIADTSMSKGILSGENAENDVHVSPVNETVVNSVDVGFKRFKLLKPKPRADELWQKALDEVGMNYGKKMLE